MATYQDIIRDFDTYYNEAWYAWNPFFPEAEMDLRYFLGDQWDATEKKKLKEDGRNAFVFNRIRRNIQMVTGYQCKHRLSSIVLPREDQDQQVADQLTKLLMYGFSYADAYQIISDCFGGALKTGFNLCSLWVDYRDDPINGDVKLSREPYNGFILDPYFTSLDFSDCGYILRRKYLSVDHVASLLPGQEKDVQSLYRIGWERDSKFTWLPYQRQPNGQDLMAYNEMYIQKWRQVPTLVDMETGEMLPFDVDNDVINIFLQQYPQLKVIDRPQRYIEQHVIVNDHVMRSDMNPYDLDEYPFVPFTAIFEPESDQWDLKIQSLVRCMRDPQCEANRRRSQMIDILDSQINSGWIADENSVINSKSLFQSSQGKVIWRREGSAPGAIEKIPPAQIPPSMFQMQELFDRDMMDIAGINDAAFGQTDNAQESGVMMMLRQGAALVNLQELFDNLRVSQREISRKMIKMMQNWSDGKIKRILNEDIAPSFRDTNLTKYDMSIQEGLLTDTQKQMYFRQLVDLRGLGAPVTGEMLAKAAPIQGKTEYTEQIAELEKQQAEAAQRQQQIEQQVMVQQGQMSQAKAISDVALGKERFTRAIANMGLHEERNAESIQNRAQASLDRAKTMKELQSMDDDRLIKFMNIVKMMEEMSRQEELENKSDDLKISAQAAEPQQNVPGVGSLLQELPNNQLSEVPNA